MNFLKRTVAAIFARAGYEQLSVFIGWARVSGWWRSMSFKKPVDAAGAPLPWYSYPAIHFIESRLPAGSADDLRVFEFGSGNSTLWWAQRSREVVAVEDNAVWYNYVTSSMPPSVSYKLADGRPAYVEALSNESGPFDIVVVDGSHREDCAREAAKKLTERGVVIFDNSDLPSHARAIDLLKAAGLKELQFYGLGPMNGHPWGTSIFYRDGNLFSI